MTFLIRIQGTKDTKGCKNKWILWDNHSNRNCGKFSKSFVLSVAIKHIDEFAGSWKVLPLHESEISRDMFLWDKSSCYPRITRNWFLDLTWLKYWFSIRDDYYYYYKVLIEFAGGRDVNSIGHRNTRGNHLKTCP